MGACSRKSSRPAAPRMGQYLTIKAAMELVCCVSQRDIRIELYETASRSVITSISSSNPMMEGPWCRFRREARARERHRHRSRGQADVLDPGRPIREADFGCPGRLECCGNGALAVATGRSAFGRLQAAESESPQSRFSCNSEAMAPTSCGIIDRLGPTTRSAHQNLA